MKIFIEICIFILLEKLEAFWVSNTEGQYSLLGSGQACTRYRHDYVRWRLFVADFSNGMGSRGTDLGFRAQVQVTAEHPISADQPHSFANSGKCKSRRGLNLDFDGCIQLFTFRTLVYSKSGARCIPTAMHRPMVATYRSSRWSFGRSYRKKD